MVFKIRYQDLYTYDIDTMLMKAKSKNDAECIFYGYNGERYDILEIKKFSKNLEKTLDK